MDGVRVHVELKLRIVVSLFSTHIILLYSLNGHQNAQIALLVRHFSPQKQPTAHTQTLQPCPLPTQKYPACSQTTHDERKSASHSK